MNNVMGIINLAGDNACLSELTKDRCLAAVPFAARYRLIDFSLTNLIRSGINNIAIFARKNYRSLIAHVGNGADWELNKRHGGLYVLPPFWEENGSLGDLEFFGYNWDYIERSMADHLLVTGSSFIANTDYLDLIERHIEQKADVTLLSAYSSSSNAKKLAIQLDLDHSVTDIADNLSGEPIFTGVFIIKKSCLFDLVHSNKQMVGGNFLVDTIWENLSSLNVRTAAHEGYGSFIESSVDYFRENIALLDPNNYFRLFQPGKNVSTKISNYKPAKFEKTANVNKSIISSGCQVAGNVEKSMLSRAVIVEEGSTIKNSIILDHCRVKSGAYIENAIIDKYSVLSTEDIIIGKSDDPHVIGKIDKTPVVPE
ncbi:glucose-1-phosphate adenylyltransferase [Gracilibacillus ureilyticus]|uniref:Glucose-1-phosphate adenylyltransferase n=1 Tax=Gracilibacillus ureilyticus TaxID=531814 RepID=A0A1H9LJH8_9BACI|nr:glucose-1-phosphate adenylyltransferase subunit GlgD [Gracilibacillus ureilyticus]SER11357.1 glucose-1-phosphate adenylyltransferase [Gracilibacillus ureilyticus]